MDENAHSRVPPSASSRTRQSTTVSTVSSSARPHTQQHSLQLQQEEPQSQLNDYPHLAGSPNCLCAVCHLKDGVFPRRQDGKIVLPVPWPLPSLSEQRHSELGGRPRGLTTSTGLHVPGGVGTSSQAQRWTSSTFIAGSNSSDHRLGTLRRESPRTNTDRGEGSSQTSTRVSGRGRAFSESSRPSPVASSHAADPVEGRMPRTVPDRLRSFRRSKPYGRIGKVDPRPQPSHSEQQEAGNMSGHDMSSVYLHPPISQPTAQVAETSGDFRSDPREDAQQPQNFRPPSHVTPNLPTSPPTATPGAFISENFPRATVGIPDSRDSHLSFSFWNPQPPSQGSSWNERPPTSPLSQPISLEGPQDQYRFIHSKPQGSQSRRVAAPSSLRVVPQPSISQPPQNYFAWRSREEELETSEPLVRFQEPVVSDMSVGDSPTQRGQLPIKWDTERKRRQEFSHSEQGSEKSNFRHYSSSKIDFES